MASTAAIQEFRAKAEQRLTDVISRFQRHLSIDPLPPDRFYRAYQPEHRAAIDIDRNAQFLEVVAGRLGLPAHDAPAETDPAPVSSDQVPSGEPVGVS